MSQNPRFEIVAPAHPDILTAACNPQMHATFKRLFERPQLEPFAAEVQRYVEYCLLLTNGLRDIDMMCEAPQVTVTIDTLIFEDGRVLGDDESRSVAFITNRKKAAGDFVTLVRRAQQDGLNIDDLLHKLSSPEPGSSREDSYGFWLRTFARQLSRVPAATRDVSLMQYTSLPHLPRFVV